MAVRAPDDFVKAVTADLLQPEATDAKAMNEAARKASPAMAGFVDIAVRDLGGAGGGAVIEEVDKPVVTDEQIKESAEDLKNAFAKSITEQTKITPEVQEKAGEIITEFKKEAEAESQQLLETLLKGIR